jgi:hypothetical protein
MVNTIGMQLLEKTFYNDRKKYLYSFVIRNIINVLDIIYYIENGE